MSDLDDCCYCLGTGEFYYGPNAIGPCPHCKGTGENPRRPVPYSRPDEAAEPSDYGGHK